MQIERKNYLHGFCERKELIDSINWTSPFRILEETEIDFEDMRIFHNIYKSHNQY